jgi:hypothetical protein
LAYNNFQKKIIEHLGMFSLKSKNFHDDSVSPSISRSTSVNTRPTPTPSPSGDRIRQASGNQEANRELQEKVSDLIVQAGKILIFLPIKIFNFFLNSIIQIIFN